MFQLLYFLIQALQPVLLPLCFATAWSLVVLLLWNIYAATRNGIATVKRLHQIPCANCQYFTDDYHLKCTVRPTIALTEEAINCFDYCPHNKPV
jgi:hypothetical protein